MNTFSKLVFRHRLKSARRARFAGTWPVTAVDISEFQGWIDWTQVPDQVAIIRVSDGYTHIDPTFHQNWTNAKAAGKMRMPYHFFRPIEDLQRQIDACCNTIGQLEPGDLPMMVDLEVDPNFPSDWYNFTPDQIMDLIDQFCDGVEQRLGLRPRFLYGSPSFFNQILQNNPRLAQYELDVANWTTANSPIVPAPWTNWLFWQWTDGLKPYPTTVPGINGAVDQDRVNGTLADLAKFGFGYKSLTKRILTRLGLIKEQPLPGRAPAGWMRPAIRAQFDPSTIIQHPSPNNESRRGNDIVFLINHYTVDNFEDALARLCDRDAEVSAHYLVNTDGTIYQLVDESLAAWHAGVSFWDGYVNLNFTSIGIEIVNSGDEPYPAAQMDSVRALNQWIAQRRGIRPAYVLGHSDIALTSANHKSDPGWFFDWKSLAQLGIGVWPQPTQADYDSSAGWSDWDLTQKLSSYGYSINAPLPVLVEAFQRHFQQEVAQTPARIGVADADTRARLAYLLEFKAANARLR